MISPRLDLRLDGRVYGVDGEAGPIHALLVRPRTGDIRALVVTPNALIARERVLPIDVITGVHNGGVNVRLTRSEVDDLPIFKEKEVWDPRPRETTKELIFGGGGAKPVHAGERVDCLDAVVGSTEMVILHPSRRQVEFFVVKRVEPAACLLAAATLISNIGGHSLTLAAAHDELELLPVYRPDMEVEADVLDAIWNHTGLTAPDVQNVRVHASKGFVELEGSTRREGTQNAIVAAARAVPGVATVIDHLRLFTSVGGETAALSGAEAAPDAGPGNAN
jgi:hypothetical protein